MADKTDTVTAATKFVDPKILAELLKDSDEPLPGEAILPGPAPGMCLPDPIELPIEERGGLLGMPDFIPCSFGGQAHTESEPIFDQEDFDEVEGHVLEEIAKLSNAYAKALQAAETMDAERAVAETKAFRLGKELASARAELDQAQRIIAAVKMDNTAVNAKLAEVYLTTDMTIADLSDNILEMAGRILLDDNAKCETK